MLMLYYTAILLCHIRHVPSIYFYAIIVHLMASTCLTKWPGQGVPSGMVCLHPKTVHLMVPQPASVDVILGAKL